MLKMDWDMGWDMKSGICHLGDNMLHLGSVYPKPANPLRTLIQEQLRVEERIAYTFEVELKTDLKIES